jgi:hypothetical protein
MAVHEEKKSRGVERTIECLEDGAKVIVLKGTDAIRLRNAVNHTIDEMAMILRTIKEFPGK